MGELAEPLIEYVEGLVKPGRVTAKVYAGAETTNPETTPIGEGEGYMAHTENTAYGWTAPGQSFSWGWSPAAVRGSCRTCTRRTSTPATLPA